MDNWRDNRSLFAALMVPPTFWLVLFFTLPLALVWIYSFGERGPQGQTLLAFSFANYARALEWIHLGILFKSLAIAALTTAISLLIGLPVALGIAFAPKRWRGLLLVLVILPFWTNLLIRTYAWIAVLRTTGFVNTGLEGAHGALSALLAGLGWPEALGQFEPLSLLYNQRAVVVGLVYVHLPFLILPVYASLEKLDRSYLEASLDLGAGRGGTARCCCGCCGCCGWRPAIRGAGRWRTASPACVPPGWLGGRRCGGVEGCSGAWSNRPTP
ncbi:MAG: ABC transporter permease, partial [Pseudomonadota bacterium]|nr:ABC transporter permease [Pseudomonadota bacterium]